MALLVHAVVDAAAVGDLPADLDGGAGCPVRHVACGRVAALVSETGDAEEVEPTRRNLLAHTRVLEAAVAATTVLPMRFGVVAPDEDALRDDFLQDRQDLLASGLDRLGGLVEVRVRVEYEQEAAVRDVLAADPSIRRMRRTAGYDAQLRMGERIAAALDRRRERDRATVLATLEPLVSDAVAADATDHLEVVDVTVLVRAEALERLDGAVAGLGQRLGDACTVDYLGPLPPFTFAERVLGG